MAEHLTKNFVDLGRPLLGSDRTSELRLDHRERALDIRPLVTLRQELFAVELVTLDSDTNPTAEEIQSVILGSGTVSNSYLGVGSVSTSASTPEPSTVLMMISVPDLSLSA